MDCNGHSNDNEKETTYFPSMNETDGHKKSRQKGGSSVEIMATQELLGKRKDGSIHRVKALLEAPICRPRQLGNFWSRIKG